MQQVAGQDRPDQLVFRRSHGRAGFVERLLERADAQFQSQPLGQEFLNPRPRPPEPVGQRHAQRRQPRPHPPPFAEFDPRQQRVHYAVAGRGAGPLPAGTGRFVITMVNHPYGQPRSRRIVPTPVDRLKAGVSHRPRRVQWPATARAGIGIMGRFGIRLEHLGPAAPRRPRWFAGFAGRWGLRRFRLGRLRLGRVRLAVARRHDGVGLRVPPAALAFPRRPTARRPRTVLRSLVQPVPRLLQIVQQPPDSAHTSASPSESQVGVGRIGVGCVRSGAWRQFPITAPRGKVSRYREREVNGYNPRRGAEDETIRWY